MLCQGTVSKLSSPTVAKQNLQPCMPRTVLSWAAFPGEDFPRLHLVDAAFGVSPLDINRVLKSANRSKQKLESTQRTKSNSVE